jgi:hypothetical protein
MNEAIIKVIVAKIAAELLYEDGNICLCALIDQACYPGEVAKASVGTGFAADDNPMNSTNC